MTRGTWSVLALLGVSAALVAGGFVYRHLQSRPIIAWWGIEAVEMVRTAPRAELVVIEPEQGARRDRFTGAPPGDDGNGTAGRRFDVSHRPGFLHLRHVLLETVSYRFDAPVPKSPVFRYGLRFESGSRMVQFLFAPGERVVADGQGRRRVVLGPVCDRIVAYFREVERGDGEEAGTGTGEAEQREQHVATDGN